MRASLSQIAAPSAGLVTAGSELVVNTSQYDHDLLEACRGKSVALLGNARLLFKWLPLLDGLAQRIVIVPQTLEANLLSILRNCRDVERIVCEQPINAVANVGCQVVVDAASEGARPSSETAIAGGGQRCVRTEWVLATSGTTQTPKLVAHTLSSLTRSIRVDARFSRYRWGLLYDAARFAGLQVLLQVILNGSTLLVPPPRAGLAEQLEWLASERCDALIATPTLWRKMLMTPTAEKLTLQQATLGGEIADGQILRAISSRFPHARLTHVYASTEAGVGFAVHDRLPGFPVDWLTTGLRGVRLKIADNSCLLLSRSDWEQKYLGEADQLVGSDGWIDTGDVVRVADGRVLFCGRLNGSINVGGNKVFPEEVEAAVLEVLGVSAALARAKTSSLMGSLVEVLVAADGSVAASQLPGMIKSHCRTKLAAYKVPAFVRIVNTIETTETGKVSRGL